ncbi:NADP-dependent oxidoreductase [Actinosynnema sp. NPDC047251]|uniref:NADPH:quinone reductase and related Zn-dependent oxidoreductase n=1 Tax=Saccharothrix espanaensis (strain ATCC 51144 / DSM 44229 / JCM 9112 / NBRC 15066 / NRRL 15764) TaxID=1179773 RepID=K0JSV3_SACES|nr:NADP-dependent oxidoreductase [Saccharothrix espanaensis]CCH30825.1 NADPH:quinone reductase and related Zn-dependent oxidoreductase [Saccharothrix espanaensis DSM 44229]
MRAIEFAEYGGSDVLRLRDVDLPEPGPGEVRVAVRVAGVNPFDWKLRGGAMADVVKLTLPHRPGLELAGVVDAVGDGAPAAVGDEVFGWARTGSYAEYALASVVVAKPDVLTWHDAAALPAAGEAALRGLRLLDVRAGDVLLIHGAAGAVGGLATQLAVARGATVIGTGGESSAEVIRSYGATPVRYGEGLVERVRAVTRQVDAVLDTAGKGALPDSIELRGGKDRILTLADLAAFDLGIPFSGGEPGDQNAGVLAELSDLAATGRLVVRHARSYPLAEAARAQDDSATGHSGGKITLDVRG